MPLPVPSYGGFAGAAPPELAVGTLVWCKWWDGRGYSSGVWEVADPVDETYRGPELDWNLVQTWTTLPQ